MEINNIQKLVNEAKTTNDKDRHVFLSNHCNSFVRKALVFNSNISSEILKKLSQDPTLNVSYFAGKKSFEKRGFNPVDLENKCVTCKEVLNDITKCQRC